MLPLNTFLSVEQTFSIAPLRNLFYLVLLLIQSQTTLWISKALLQNVQFTSHCELALDPRFSSFDLWQHLEDYFSFNSPRWSIRVPRPVNL